MIVSSVTTWGQVGMLDALNAKPVFVPRASRHWLVVVVAVVFIDVFAGPTDAGHGLSAASSMNTRAWAKLLAARSCVCT